MKRARSRRGGPLSAGTALMMLCLASEAAWAQVPPAPPPPAEPAAPPPTAPPTTAAPEAPPAAPARPETKPVAPIAVEVAPAPSLPSVALAEILQIPMTFRLYGYIESRFNATGAEPNGDVNKDGTQGRNKPVYGDVAIPAFHIMAQGSLYSRYRYYFNLAAPDAASPTHDTPVGVRNAWLEASIFGDYLNVRVGKLYRRFGLYNEVLDTVPSFLGIEAPIVFGPLRPMLSRTTNAMVHGKASFGSSTLSYAVTAGKDEASVNGDVFSPGFDLNYNWDSTITVGGSYYTTAGTVIPGVAPGAGSPTGGVVPWMKQDKYQVYGGYGLLTLGQFLFHAEAWIAPHEGVRDPLAVLAMAKGASHFSPVNRARMGVTAKSPTAAQVNTDARYTYSTVDLRAAYTFEIGKGATPVELTPYLAWDYIRDTESISDTNYGGDGAAGESTRGIAMHNKIGVVVKPVPPVAFKAEATYAMYGFGNGFGGDAELWLSLSYQWELLRK